MKLYIKSAILDPMFEDSDAKLEIANNPDTDDYALQRLTVHNKNNYITRAVLNNPNASDDTISGIIYRLAWGLPYDKFYYTLADILTSINNVNLINYIYSSAQDYKGNPVWDASLIRNAVARNSNTPTDILASLAEDYCRDTRMYVAANPNTALETLEYLTSDTDDLVRDIATNYLAHRMGSNT